MRSRRPVAALFVIAIASIVAPGADRALAADEHVLMIMPPPPPPKVGRPTEASPFPEIQNWSSLRIRLYRTGCLGEYWVTIYGDGTVDYGGVKDVLLGNHRSHIPISTVHALVERFRSANYFQSWEIYGWSIQNISSIRVIDGCADGAKTSISFDGQTKAVEGSGTGGIPEGMPAELAALPDAIDDLAARLWLKPSAATIDALAAEPAFRGADEATALLPDMIRWGADAETVRRLIALGARNDALEQSLVLAAERIDPEVVSALLDAGGDGISPEMRDLALVAAVQRNQPMWGGRWPYGVEPEPDQRARLATLRRLLHAHADANSCTEKGAPLGRAVEFPSAVELLLAAKADPNRFCKDELPLDAAAGSPDSTRQLLAAGANPRLHNTAGKTVYDSLCGSKERSSWPATSCKVLLRWMTNHPHTAL